MLIIKELLLILLGVVMLLQLWEIVKYGEIITCKELFLNTPLKTNLKSGGRGEIKETIIYQQW